MPIGISHIGTYVPKKVLTNDDLSKIVDTNDEWISTRTGIKERYIAEKTETTVDMAISAVQNLLQKSSHNPQDIDFIICSTVTHKISFPSVAALVQKELKIPNIPAFDMGPACGGFLYLLATAESFIKSGLAKKVLCICAEKLSDIVNWEDRNTCVLFGDAAAAFIVEENPETCQIVHTIIGGDGLFGDLLYLEEQDNGKKFIMMDGLGVFKQAVRIMEDQVRMVCEQAGKTVEEIDLLIPHQANARIMTAVAERLQIPVEKAYMNVHKFGNTSSVTIPLALVDAINDGSISEGSLVACPALGGGFTWGASLLQF
ncbi:MAG: beta-ketoacyl-ACP synthase III [Brevinema sp.]